MDSIKQAYADISKGLGERSKGYAIRAKAYNQCAEPFGNSCTATLSWDHMLTADVFKFEISPEDCPSLARLTSKTAIVYIRKISDTMLDYSDITWN